MLKKRVVLPRSVQVRIKHNVKTGACFAYLSEYDIFTEADSWMELQFNINDLIYTYFEIPKSLQKKVYYMPKQDQKQVKTNVDTTSVMFGQFVTPTSPIYA